MKRVKNWQDTCNSFLDCGYDRHKIFVQTKINDNWEKVEPALDQTIMLWYKTEIKGAYWREHNSYFNDEWGYIDNILFEFTERFIDADNDEFWIARITMVR